jgi:pyrroloquinoline quinone biosynthesis protein D
MNARPLLSPQSLPRLAPHMRLRHDAARGQWTIQAPERAFMLDETAHAIVSHCDGATSLEAIVERLAAAFPDAPADVIAADVTLLLQGLADKGVVTA